MSKQKRRCYTQADFFTSGSPVTSRTIKFCKPYQVLSAFTDPAGRPTLGDFINVPQVYPAGRLDYDSEGLLILTSDKQLAHRITHPKYKLKKVYLVQVENMPEPEALKQLREGVLVRGVRTRPADVRLLLAEPDLFPRSRPIRYRKHIPTAWLELSLREGRKRQVRRMTAAVGHPTLRLIRVAIGPVGLGRLLPGQWQDVSQAELNPLRGALT